MQLKLQRSQRPGGAFGGTVIFGLDARAEYSPTEAANIDKYKLGGQVIYNSQASRKHLDAMSQHFDRTQTGSTGERAAGFVRGVASFALSKMNLNITIESLGRGHHIECKDLAELLEAESALMDACRELKQFLDAAATFNGSVILVDFDNGEKVEVAQGAIELEALPSPVSAPQQHFAYQSSASNLSAEAMAQHKGWSLSLLPAAAAALASLAIVLLFGWDKVTVVIAAVVLGSGLLMLSK